MNTYKTLLSEVAGACTLLEQGCATLGHVIEKLGEVEQELVQQPNPLDAAFSSEKTQLGNIPQAPVTYETVYLGYLNMKSRGIAPQTPKELFDLLQVAAFGQEKGLPYVSNLPKSLGDWIPALSSPNTGSFDELYSLAEKANWEIPAFLDLVQKTYPKLTVLDWVKIMVNSGLNWKELTDLTTFQENIPPVEATA